jgi:hypothetical protein
MKILVLILFIYLAIKREQIFVNSLVGEELEIECWLKHETKLPVEHCFKDACFQWDIHINTTAADNEQKKYCCATYDYLDCVKKEVRHHCKENETQLNELIEYFDNYQNSLESNECHKYKYKSFKCEFPLWATLLCFVGFIVSMGVIAFVLFGVMHIQPAN